VSSQVGLPDWVAQRLWLGSVLFIAGLGVRWMLRELRWEVKRATARFGGSMQTALRWVGCGRPVVVHSW